MVKPGPRAAATSDQPASEVCPVLTPTSFGKAASKSFQVWSTRSPAIAAVCLSTIARTRGFWIAARASSVTSRALETGPEGGGGGPAARAGVRGGRRSAPFRNQAIPPLTPWLPARDGPDLVPEPGG